MNYKQVVIVEQNEMVTSQVTEQLALFFPDGTPLVPGGYSKEMDDLKTRLSVLEAEVFKDKPPK